MKCVDEGGCVVMTFDLADEQQWKKRVWPRREYPRKLTRWNTVEVCMPNMCMCDLCECLCHGRHTFWLLKHARPLLTDHIYHPKIEHVVQPNAQIFFTIHFECSITVTLLQTS